MKAAAVQLTAAFDKAKGLLAVRPNFPEEVAAQQLLKDAMDSVKRQMFGNLDDCKTQIKDLAEQIWTTVQKLDI
jgi:AmiR/NasT family two-component response regulator